MKKLIELTLWHEDCWMLEMSRKHPSVEIIVDDICSDGTDILATVVVHADNSDNLDAALPAARSHPSIKALDVLDRSSSDVRLHARYSVEESIYAQIVQSSLTPIGEIFVQDDRERWSLICDSANIRSAIDHLKQVATVDVRRVSAYRPDGSDPIDLVDELDEALSDRQRTYLLSALDDGYYTWPRNISAKELADKHDVSGPTALEHLRKGESTVLRHILSELRNREIQSRRR